MALPPEAHALPDSLVRGATLLADRDAILPLLPKKGVIAEIGVGYGDFSSKIISVCQPAHFVAIDTFQLHHEPDLWGRTAAEVFGGRTHRETYEERFSSPLSSNEMSILEGSSSVCLRSLSDRSLDVIYIDADHRYEFVKEDLYCAAKKIRSDGWIILNDYIMVPTLGADVAYGVVNATHEFMLDQDWGMQHLALHTRMFCDVVIRPAGLLLTLAEEKTRLVHEVAALRASTSWRVTSPFRVVADLLRRRRRAVR